MHNGVRLTVAQYEEQFKQTLPHDASDFDIDVSDDPAPVVLVGLKDKQRIYDRRKIIKLLLINIIKALYVAHRYLEWHKELFLRG